MILWFTGLPCSGKTTIAERVCDQLEYQGYNVQHLDGDIVRKDLTSDLGFSKEDRNENLDRIACVAELLSQNGVLPVCSFISPYEEKRKELRERFDNFVLCYVEASVDVCSERDVKGMYERAKNGEIDNFTGISDPYEEPTDPDIVLHTNEEEIHGSVSKVIDYIV